MTWLITGFACLYWLVALSYLDRLSMPAWKARKGWRWVAAVTLFCCWVVATKYLVTRAELRSLIQSCR